MSFTLITKKNHSSCFASQASLSGIRLASRKVLPTSELHHFAPSSYYSGSHRVALACRRVRRRKKRRALVELGVEEKLFYVSSRTCATSFVHKNYYQDKLVLIWLLVEKGEDVWRHHVTAFCRLLFIDHGWDARKFGFKTVPCERDRILCVSFINYSWWGSFEYEKLLSCILRNCDALWESFETFTT